MVPLEMDTQPVMDKNSYTEFWKIRVQISCLNYLDLTASRLSVIMRPRANFAPDKYNLQFLLPSALSVAGAAAVQMQCTVNI